MKHFKLALPMFALILAIGASAFTTTKHASKPTDGTFFWYRFEDGQLTEVVSPSKISKEDANDITQCDDTSGPDCARGYDQQVSGSLPQTAPSVTPAHILRD